MNQWPALREGGRGREEGRDAPFTSWITNWKASLIYSTWSSRRPPKRIDRLTPDKTNWITGTIVQSPNRTAWLEMDSKNQSTNQMASFTIAEKSPPSNSNSTTNNNNNESINHNNKKSMEPKVWMKSSSRSKTNENQIKSTRTDRQTDRKSFWSICWRELSQIGDWQEPHKIIQVTGSGIQVIFSNSVPSRLL